jgi:hypothetical protein
MPSIRVVSCKYLGLDTNPFEKATPALSRTGELGLDIQCFSVLWIEIVKRLGGYVSGMLESKSVYRHSGNR